MKKKPSNSLIVLNNDLITKVISELGNENFTFIINLIEELHPADTADLLETLNNEETNYKEQMEKLRLQARKLEVKKIAAMRVFIICYITTVNIHFLLLLPLVVVVVVVM